MYVYNWKRYKRFLASMLIASIIVDMVAVAAFAARGIFVGLIALLVGLLLWLVLACREYSKFEN